MIYLNNAATSYPKPKCVTQTVEKYLHQPPLNAKRSGFENTGEDIICECRKNIALLFNVPSPEQVILTSGATESLNASIYGLDLIDYHVITTEVEHNSILRPLKHLEKKGLVELSIISCDSMGLINLQDIKQAIKSNTKLIAINHCSNVTGTLVDLQRIAEIAHTQKVVLLVDASQSAGNYPIDFSGSGIDILAFTGHKSLYGLQGSGGYVVRKDLDIKPFKVGGTGIRSELLYQPEGLPIQYEAGTPNICGIASMKAGIDFIYETGMHNILGKKANLLSYLYKMLSKINGITIYGPGSPGTVLTFNINGVEPGEAAYILSSSFDIITRAGLHCAPLIHKRLGSYPLGSIRISPSFFTSKQDMETLIGAVKMIGEM